MPYDSLGLAKIGSALDLSIFASVEGNINYTAFDIVDLRPFAHFLVTHYKPVRRVELSSLATLQGLFDAYWPEGKDLDVEKALRDFNKDATEASTRGKIKIEDLDERVRGYFKEDPNINNWPQEWKKEFLTIYLLNNEYFSWWHCWCTELDFLVKQANNENYELNEIVKALHKWKQNILSSIK